MADSKVSALTAAASVLGSDLLYLSRAPNDRQIPVSALLGPRQALGQHKVALICDGDSKANEPGDAIAWACARRQLSSPAIVPIGVGGSQSGSSTSAPIGLTAASRLATIQSTIAAQSAAGYVVDVSLKIGTNDIAGSVAPATVVANVRKYWEAYARPAGARYLILNSVDPRGDTTSLNPAIIALNRLLRSYAAANAFDVIFIDCHSYIVDPTSAAGSPLGGAGNAYGAATYDGLHQSVNGPLLASPAYEDSAVALYGRRPSLVLSKADIYVVAGVSMNNMIGFDTGYNPTGTGRTAAIGGADGITNSGSGTKAGTPPLGFTDSGTLTGTASVTRSVQTITLFGQSVPVVRYAFAGTPTSNLQIGIDQLNYSQASATYEVQAELAFYANALTGFQTIGLTGNNGMPNALLGSTNLVNLSDGLSKVDGLHRVASPPSPAAVPYQFNSTILLYAKAGTPLGGSIDLIKASMVRTGPIPAATP